MVNQGRTFLVINAFEVASGKSHATRVLKPLLHKADLASRGLLERESGRNAPESEPESALR